MRHIASLELENLIVAAALLRRRMDELRSRVPKDDAERARLDTELASIERKWRQLINYSVATCAASEPLVRP